MASIEGLCEDGWAGNIVSGELLIPSVRGRETFVVEIYVPESWESYNNAVTVIVNDMTIGSYQVKAGFNKIRFTVDTESMKGKILPFKIIPEDVYVPSFFDPMSEDKRKLSFVLVGVGFVK